MTRAVIPRWLFACIALTALLSGYSILLRHKAESLNRAVGIAADMDVVHELGASQGVPPEKALAGLKARGLTAVVLPEELITDLVGSGQVRVHVTNGTI